MSKREELIKQAEAKWKREQLIAQAEAKWQAENAPQPQGENDALDTVENLSRRAASGMTLGLSEPVLNAIGAGASEIADKIVSDDPLKWEDFKQAYQDNVAHSKQIKEQGGASGTVAEVAGALMPGSLAARTVGYVGKGLVKGGQYIAPYLDDAVIAASKLLPESQILTKAGQGALALTQQASKGALEGGAQAAIEKGVGQAAGTYGEGEGPSVTDAMIFGAALPAGFQVAKGGVGATKALLSRGADVVSDVTSSVANKVIPKGGVTEAIINNAKVAGQSLKNVPKAIDDLLNPKYAQSLDDDLATAKKLGLDEADLPSSVKFGKNSKVTKIEQSIAQTDEELLNAHNAKIQKMVNAQDQKLTEIAGGQRYANLDEAGEDLRASYNKHVDDFHNSIEANYDSAWKQAPGLTLSKRVQDEALSKLEGLRRGALALAKLGTPAEQAQANHVLGFLKVVTEGVQKGNYKQLTETMRSVGRYAFGGGGRVAGQIPPDVKGFRDIYGVLKNSLLETTKGKVSKKLYQKIVDENERMTNFLRKNEMLVDTMTDPTRSGKEIFQKFVGSGQAKRAEALKEIVKDKQLMKRLAVAHLDDVKNLTAEGHSLTRFANSIRNDAGNADSVMRLFLDPEDQKLVKQMAELGGKYGQGFMNTSGTETSRTLLGQIKALPEKLAEEAQSKETLRQLIANAEARRMAAQEAAQKAATQAAAPEAQALKVMSGMQKEAPGIQAPTQGQSPGALSTLRQVMSGKAPIAAYQASKLMAPEEDNNVLVIPEAAKPEAIAKIYKSNISSVKRAKIIKDINDNKPVNLDALKESVGYKQAMPSPTPRPVGTRKAQPY